MRHLFLVNTPAHVHLYKHVVGALEAEGHEVTVLARDYGCTVALAEWHDLPFEIYGACGTSVGSLTSNLLAHVARITRLARRFDPDLIFGVGAYATIAGIATRTPPILVLDSEPTGLDHSISRPYARAILTPATFRKSLGSDHYVFRGFKESAYLLPTHFSPSEFVRDRLGLAPDDRFVVVRLNAFGSSHDIGQEGFTPEQRRRLVERLAEYATVLVSDEGGDLPVSELPARRFDLHPALIHDALAAADLLVADTQTMVTEAALLGTPAVRSNTFVGDDDMGNFLELERRELVENCETYDEALRTAERLLSDPNCKSKWQRRRDRYVTDLVDLTEVLHSLALDPSPEDVEGLFPYREVDSVRDPEPSQVTRS